MQIHLFNKITKPILLYGCECWGFGKKYVLEKVLKIILGLKMSTTACIVYGETGVKPLSIDIECRIISYWAKLAQPSCDKLSNKLYDCMLHYYINCNQNVVKCISIDVLCTEHSYKMWHDEHLEQP